MRKPAETHKTEVVATTALRQRPGELVEAMLRGTEIVLTRYGRPIGLMRGLTPDEQARFGRAA